MSVFDVQGLSVPNITVVVLGHLKAKAKGLIGPRKLFDELIVFKTPDLQNGATQTYANWVAPFCRSSVWNAMSSSNSLRGPMRPFAVAFRCPHCGMETAL